SCYFVFMKKSGCDNHISSSRTGWSPHSVALVSLLNFTGSATSDSTDIQSG
ncbi:hypothetical protein BDU57DRAFT_451799, partial [Ampelomyces quisqualis]